MNKKVTVTIFFLLLWVISFSQKKIEKYRIYPSLQLGHRYDTLLYEKYNYCLIFSKFMRFKLYSSYGKAKGGKFVLGLGNKDVNTLFINGDTIYRKLNDCNKIFLVLNKDFYGDSLYINSFGLIKNSYVKLNRILYDVNIDDELYEFSVRTLDKTRIYDEDEVVTLVAHPKIRITKLIFSKKIGFYSITYNDLNEKCIIEEYYYPKNYRKAIRKYKKRERTFRGKIAPSS